MSEWNVIHERDRQTDRQMCRQTDRDRDRDQRVFFDAVTDLSLEQKGICIRPAEEACTSNILKILFEWK